MKRASINDFRRWYNSLSLEEKRMSDGHGLVEVVMVVNSHPLDSLKEERGG